MLYRPNDGTATPPSKFPVSARAEPGTRKHLAQAEIATQFATMQARIVDLHNSAGRSCLVREPTPAQLARIKTVRQLEALALVYTRPLPDSAASRAVHDGKEAAAA